MYEFTLTDSAPTPNRFGGGRERQNPFDEMIRRSYEDNLEALGKWVHFRTEPGKIKTAIGQIRAAAAHANLGSEIRKDDSTGEMWFRGVDKREMTRRAALPSEASNGTPEDDSPASPGPLTTQDYYQSFSDR